MTDHGHLPTLDIPCHVCWTPLQALGENSLWRWHEAWLQRWSHKWSSSVPITWPGLEPAGKALRAQRSSQRPREERVLTKEKVEPKLLAFPWS